MENRNTVIRDIAIVDLTGASAEKLAQIKSISGAALLLLGQDQDVSGIDIKDVASLIRLPGGVKFKSANGVTTISAADECEDKVYLMANGVLTIAPDVTPEMIKSRYAGMMINGVAICSRSVNDALTAIGANVNGKIDVYPDGAVLMMEQTILLDGAFAEGSAPGTYAVNKVVALDAVAAETALARGIRFFTDNVVCAHAARVCALKLMRECSPDVTEIPDGFEYNDGLKKVDRLRARRLRGRVFTQNDVELEFAVTADDLKRLDALHTTGRLTMSQAQLDAFMDLDLDCGALTLRDPGDINVDGDYALNAAALESLEGKRRLCVAGDLSLGGDVSAQMLRDKFTSLEVGGDVIAKRDLWAVLPGLGTIGGVLIEAEKPGTAPNKEAREEGVTCIEGMAMLKM